MDVPPWSRDSPAEWQVRFLKEETYNALAAADLAIVSSGTAMSKPPCSASP